MAASWRWASVVVLLGGGALTQLVHTGRVAAVAMMAGVGAAALALHELGTSLARRGDAERARVLRQDVNDVVLLVRDGRVLLADGALERTLRVDPTRAAGLGLHELLRTTEPERLDELFTHALGQRDRGAAATGVALCDADGLVENGQYVDVTVRDRSHDRSLRAYVVTISDATDRTRAQRALALAASTDPDTGLPNFERLAELVDMTLHRARRKGDHVALLAVGLDRYESLVEGFDEADRASILVEVARRIRSTVRLEDPVGRLGQDRFGVLLGGLEPRIGRAFALDVADRIARLIADPVEVSGTRLTLSVSVGAAHRAQGSPEPTPIELIGDAEESLAQVRANTNRWKDTSPA